MSFSENVKTELRKKQIKSGCCRRAAVLGLLCGASRSENGALTLSLPGEENAVYAVQLFRKQFNREPTVTYRTYLGRKIADVTLLSSSANEMLDAFDTSDDPGKTVFKCDSCEEHFFKGLFIAIGSCSDPGKTSHLALFFHNAERAAKIYVILQKREIVPGILNRKNGCELYLKKRIGIIDFMTLIGEGKLSFDLLNRQIELDIRNNENRATNCVTRNIQSTVSASSRQMEAIEKLIDLGKFETLPDELLITARLRMSNEEATLAELAAMHDPPISKSGLNHRLEKIIEFAKDAD